MQALVLDANGQLSLQDRRKPSSTDECVIRVTAAGICGTDLELLRGYAGFAGVPGHEFVGVVEAAPAADAAWIGRRVVGEITVGCGECQGCAAAGRGHCDVRTVIGIRGRDGAFAEYLSLPSRQLHTVPASVDDRQAVFVEPLAAACRIPEQIAIGAGTRAAVLGAGRLGLLVAQVLRVHGADVTVIGRRASSRALAATLGLRAIGPEEASAAPRSFDLVVDATGDSAGFAHAASLVRPRGTIVVKSTIHGETPVALSPVVVDEITILGSRCGPFAPAIALLESGRVTVEPLIAGVYPLERHADAFERARHGGKVLLVPAPE